MWEFVYITVYKYFQLKNKYYLTFSIVPTLICLLKTPRKLVGTSHLDLEAKLYRLKWLQLPQQIRQNPLPWDKKVMVQCSAEHYKKGGEVFKGRWIHFKLK